MPVTELTDPRSDATAVSAENGAVPGRFARAVELDGQVRKLLPAERHLLVEHLLRLDPLSRFMRFGGVVSDAAIVRHANRVISGDACALGYFVEGELRAVAELHPMPRVKGKPSSAEAAFSVERPWQGKGIGSALMRQLVLLAQNRDIEELQVVFLPNNGRMKHLAVNHAADFSVDDEEVVGRVRAPHPTFFSRLREFVGDVAAVWSAAFDLQERSLPPSMRGS